MCSLTAGNDLRGCKTRRDFRKFFSSLMLIAGLFFRNFFSGFEKFADFCTNLRIIRKFSAKSATGATGAKHAKKFFILITRRSGVQVSPPQPQKVAIFDKIAAFSLFLAPENCKSIFATFSESPKDAYLMLIFQKLKKL